MDFILFPLKASTNQREVYLPSNTSLLAIKIPKTIPKALFTDYSLFNVFNIEFLFQ